MSGGRGIPVNVKGGAMAPRKVAPRKRCDVRGRDVRCPTCGVEAPNDCQTADGKEMGSHYHRPRSRMAARESNKKRGLFA